MKKAQCDVCDDLLLHIICDVLRGFSRQKPPEMCKHWVRPAAVLRAIPAARQSKARSAAQRIGE